MPRGDREPRAFLTAQWRHLVLATFAVDAALLAPLVPRGTTLDALDGQPCVSVVAFRFLHTRVRGVPVPFHRDFEEVNLRFYVRRHADDGPRRGVVFVKEIVPRRLVAFVARRAYGEPYVAMPTSSEISPPSGEGEGRTAYRFGAGARACTLDATVRGAPTEPEPGSPEEFVTDHAWGYNRRADGGTLEYGVEHPRWRVWRAESGGLRGALEAVYGPAFAPFLEREPVSLLVADGSAIVVREGRRVA